MPQLPVPERNYQISDPATKVDLLFWNTFSGSVAARLGTLEEQRIEYADVIADLRTQGQARIDAAITPLIEQTGENLAQLGESIQAQEGRLAELGEQMEEILSGGIPADSVSETAGRVFVTPAQRDWLVPASAERAGVMSAADKAALDDLGESVPDLASDIAAVRVLFADLRSSLAFGGGL